MIGKSLGVVGALLLTLAAPRLARADDMGAKAAEERAAAAEEEQKKKERLEGPGEGDKDFGHGKQFGLRVGFVGGYRIVMRYDDSPYCSTPDLAKPPKDQKKFCGFGMPSAIDLGLSFAIIDGLEPFVWARFGLAGEAQTDTHAVQIYGVGARIYTMSDSAFKIFVQPAAAYEVEQGGNAPNYHPVDPQYHPEWKKDFVFHLSAGPQYDFARAFGIYASGGLSVGILRAIHSSMELSGGLQIRVP